MLVKEVYEVTCRKSDDPSQAAARLARYIVERWMTSCQDNPVKAAMIADPLANMLRQFFVRENPVKIRVNTHTTIPEITEVL